MTLPAFILTNYPTQDPGTYFANNDANWKISSRFAQWFAGHAQTVPNMTVAVDAGMIFTPGVNAPTLTEVAAQNTSTLTAPAANDRYTLVYVDAVSGTIGTLNGAENVSPVKPAIPAGKLPVCWVLMHTTTIVITSTLITDARAFPQGQTGPGVPWVAATGTADAITATYTPAVALLDGVAVGFRASAANATATPTFAPNSLTAHTITRLGGQALKAGDIPAAGAEVIVRYNLANTRWELLDPAVAAIPWAVDSGAADVMVVTNTPPVPALYDGLMVMVRANHANATTTPTLNVDSLGAKTITKKGGTALVPGDIPAALAECMLRYNLANTRWELLNPVSTPGASCTAFVNLVIANNASTPTTKVDIAADEILTADSNGGTLRKTAFSATVDFSTSGAANGLDAGSIASNTWYYLYVISKPDGTFASLASTSRTAPTLPSGYTGKKFVGNMRTNGSSQLYTTRQCNQDVQYIVAPSTTIPNFPLLLSTTIGNVSTPTFGTVSVSAWVPNGNCRLWLVNGGSVTAMLNSNGNFGNNTVAAATNPGQSVRGNDSDFQITSWQLENNTNIFAAVNNGNVRLFLCGYTDYSI